MSRGQVNLSIGTINILPFPPYLNPSYFGAMTQHQEATISVSFYTKTRPNIANHFDQAKLNASINDGCKRQLCGADLKYQLHASLGTLEKPGSQA